MKSATSRRLRASLSAGFSASLFVPLVTLGACLRAPLGEGDDGLELGDFTSTSITPLGPYDDTGPPSYEGEDFPRPRPEGSSSGGEDFEDYNCNEREVWVENLFQANCASCHNPEAAAGGFVNVTDLDALINDGKIEPGNARASPLFIRLSSNGPDMMPPPGIGPLDGLSIERVGEFIDECAVDFEVCGPVDGPFDIDTQMIVMEDDIRSIVRSARPHTRYLTLAHLYNAGYCESQIQIFRDAMVFALNALSSEPAIVVPEAIVGSFETIYRIDLRDYGWNVPVTTIVDTADPLGNGLRDEAITFDDKWDLIVFDMLKAYAPNPGLGGGAAGELQEETEQSIFSLMGDEFAFRAMQAPTVHDVLELPLTIEEADVRFLGEPRGVQQAALSVVRAGLRSSGVAVRNRIVERLQQPQGRFYWVTYDFPDETVASDIFASPIGPVNPFESLLLGESHFFREAGGQALIQLPNGLMTGLIYTSPDSEGRGIRSNRGDRNIVTHSATEDSAVLNVISCMSCHRNGLIAFDDEIRPSVELNPTLTPETVDVLQRIHPLPDEFRRIVARDSDGYLEALRDLGVSLDPSTPSELFANYEYYTFQNVGTNVGTAELGVQVADLLACAVAVQGWDDFLFENEGFVERDTFDGRFGECIEFLDLGTPVSAIPIEDL